MREHVTMEVSGKSFAVRVVSGWSKLSEDGAEVGSESEFEGTLDKTWQSVFAKKLCQFYGWEWWSRGMRRKKFPLWSIWE